MTYQRDMQDVVLDLRDKVLAAEAERRRILAVVAAFRLHDHQYLTTFSDRWYALCELVDAGPPGP